MSDEILTELAGLERVAVEELEPGDYVLVGKRTGLREVLEVKRFPKVPLRTVDGRHFIEVPEVLVIVYKPTSLGQAFENRAKATGGSYYHRTEASFTRRPGELVERRART